MAYVDLPPGERSVREVAAQLGKHPNLIYRWSSKHQWRRRADDYDQHMAQVYLKAKEEARRDMGERHAKLAAAFLGKLVGRLQTLDPDELSPRDMAYWLDTATKVERMALGEPAKVEVSGPEGGPVQFEQLGEDKQRERLRQLIAEANKRLEHLDDEHAGAGSN